MALVVKDCAETNRQGMSMIRIKTARLLYEGHRCRNEEKRKIVRGAKCLCVTPMSDLQCRRPDLTAIIAALARRRSRPTASMHEQAKEQEFPSSGTRSQAAMSRLALPLQLLHTLSHVAVKNFADSTARKA
jgi:hypothetical protein